MRYAQIRSLDISNGEGIGIALFVQGCHFHCKNCFNQETWDFAGGKEWTPDIRARFIELANRPYIKRISFLGGEPMAEENYIEVCSVMSELRKRFPDKSIWLYTGYEWNELVRLHPEVQLLTDVVVAGLYKDELKDVGNRITKWAGSINQKVIVVSQISSS